MDYYEEVSNPSGSDVTMVPYHEEVSYPSGSDVTMVPYNLEEGAVTSPPVNTPPTSDGQIDLKKVYAGIATSLLLSIITLALVVLLLVDKEEGATTLGPEEAASTTPGPLYSFLGHGV